MPCSARTLAATEGLPELALVGEAATGEIVEAHEVDRLPHVHGLGFFRCIRRVQGGRGD